MTAESRKQWTLFPALIDSTVFTTLIFFLVGGLRGLAILFVSILIWSYLFSAVFPGSRTNYHSKLRLGWSLAWIALLWAVFR